MSRFTPSTTPLADLQIIERKRLGDDRGFLSRLFCREEFAALGWKQPVAQINHTQTVQKGTIRGMHFQYPPYSEMKLVSCLQGEIWDVAVDIRVNSPTYLQWYGVNLSAKNNKALLLPQGFAHGFQSLSNNVVILYCHSAPYNSAFEGGLNPRDPGLAINWPIPVTEISKKDISIASVNEGFKGVSL